MKIFLLGLLLITSLSGFTTPTNGRFIINGTINCDNRTIYLVWYDVFENRLIDSSQVIDGKFQYSGFIAGYSDRFYIKFDPNNKYNGDSLNNVQIPIDNSIMTLKLELFNFSNYKLQGCKSCEQLDFLEKQFKPYYDKSDAYQKIIQDSKVQQKEIGDYQRLDLKVWSELKRKVYTWIWKNKSSSLAPYLLDSWRTRFTDDELEVLYHGLDNFQKNSFYGTKVQQLIGFNFFKKKQLGQPAPDFNKPDVNGNPVTLKTINFNNYILLDFWASWCKPCRDSHPKLIDLFERYKSDSFQIIGISDDDNDKDKWQRAIRQDSIFIWPHILRGSRNEITPNSDLHELYFIKMLPTKILIDPGGKIIGRFEGEETFDECKQALFNIFKY